MVNAHIKSQYSCNSCSGFTKILRKMCPDSDIATKIVLEEQNVDI